ncbi:MAG: peptidoglycan bridge formation glycyltransferase FemA/FemB family protein [Candidatus Portnoybacteria bacterium]|nr:peptidoglycan bridge formation glycyltransferase FemA/FemB family protein [Candidatus Portnoybacteria bacterium]
MILAMTSMLQIFIINDKNTWESFIKSCDEYTFFHSWSWGEFNLLMGYKAWRLGIYENDDLAGAVLVLGIKAKRGSFLFVPHGPITKNPKSEISSCLQETCSNSKQTKNTKIQNVLNCLVAYLKDLDKAENYAFIRVSPLIEKNEENEKLFKNLRFRAAPIHMHAESTLLLDITKPDEELLTNMRKTTRYLIRQAEKGGVRVEIENPLTGKNFLRLQNEVVIRKHFVAFSERQINSEMESLGKNGELAIFNARYKEEIIASALIIFYGDRAFYYQAASASKFKNIPAPYLLVWRAIQEAKRRGCTTFDFYGASPDDQPNHPWAGPTLFKKGFGGYRVDYLPAQDFIVSWKYWFTWLIETARRIKRGF